MFKFLHAADIHLDSPLRGLDRYDGCPADEVRGATRRALDRLVRLAVAERVAFVVIAGDVYDGDWPDHGTGLFFARKMAELRDAGIPAYLISGNHDARNKMTRDLRLPDGVHLLGSTRPETLHLPDVDVAIHGQSFATEKVSDDLAARYPDPVAGCFNLGLLHTSADGREGAGRYAPCTVETLRARGYDYWALGHVHTREEVDARDAPVVFPGNVQGRHAREPGAKGCVLVTVDSGRATAREFRPLDVLRWATLRVDAAGLAHADDIPDAVAGRLPGLLAEADGRGLAVRVEVVGATPLHGAIHADPVQVALDVQNAANAHGAGLAWVEKVKLLTRPPADPGPGAGGHDGPLAEVRRLLDELGTDEAFLQRFADAELADLRRKVPPELKGDDRLDLGSPDVLRGLIGQVGPLLDAQFRRAREAS